ncbi:MAG: TIGR00159 family protein [Sphingobacteriaceae bacterium]|nr:TIGR00159 family protein [Sphingobacteriaceae bacterium]
MFETLFANFNWRSVIDISLVLVLLYQLYKLVRGSLAVNILLGLVAIYVLYLVVDALELRLLARILGQFIGVGVISLIILFQPEIRRFLLMIGKNAAFKNRGWIRRLFSGQVQSTEQDFNYVQEAVNAAWRMAHERTGMLVVFARTSELQFFANTGETLDAKISSRLLESLFNKYSPLHDGAVIVANGKCKAAGCVLPISENPDIPDDLGLRHRSALGISEHSDAVVLVVSEETGRISLAINGRLHPYTDRKKLITKLGQLLA